MHEPANIPLEVMCHEEEMKHASTVFQFQSIEILQPDPPILISIWLAPVDVGMAIAAVLAILADPMSMLAASVIE